MASTFAHGARAGRVAAAYTASTQPARRRPRSRRAAWLMLSPAILGLAIFFIYPLVANIFLSFTAYNLVSPPKWIGLTNYRYLFTQDTEVGAAALNTLWFVVILVPLRTIAALGVAGLLVRVRHARGLWRTLFYLPALIPPVASVVAFVFLFNPGTGPVNHILGFFGIHGPLWFNSPAWAKPSLAVLGVWVLGDILVIFLASLLDVPQEQYEAASLDGTNGMQKVWYVTIPTIMPVIIFAVITGIVAALQYFTEAAVASTVASGAAGVDSVPAAVFGYPSGSLLTYTQWLYIRGFSSFQLGYAAALAVLLFIVAGTFVTLLLRQLKIFTPDGAS